MSYETVSQTTNFYTFSLLVSTCTDWLILRLFFEAVSDAEVIASNVVGKFSVPKVL
jgi:hypothetical protein